jgi:hypothetical protein
MAAAARGTSASWTSSGELRILWGTGSRGQQVQAVAGGVECSSCILGLRGGWALAAQRRKQASRHLVFHLNYPPPPQPPGAAVRARRSTPPSSTTRSHGRTARTTASLCTPSEQGWLCLGGGAACWVRLGVLRPVRNAGCQIPAHSSRTPLGLPQNLHPLPSCPAGTMCSCCKRPPRSSATGAARTWVPR